MQEEGDREKEEKNGRQGKGKEKHDMERGSQGGGRGERKEGGNQFSLVTKVLQDVSQVRTSFIIYGSLETEPSSAAPGDQPPATRISPEKSEFPAAPRAP